jgi:methyl-accepting chemotaxis protein
LFEEAVKRDEISEAALFDRNYRSIPNTNPEQLMTRFTDFTDRVLPPIQEALLTFNTRVAFCAAVDNNGYLPTHNTKFSKPQGNDPVWNAANCRNKRLFNDRTGLAAGRNTKPFLLQTYRRDMGGGQFVLMKDVSAPIFVNGRHWGGFRMGYRV